MLLDLLKSIRSVDDERFDAIYPPDIRKLSTVHWTPVRVARRAADFLVRQAGTRVLDIGCGPGKFCIVGALTSSGSFTGVEQRRRMFQVARRVLRESRIANAQVIHANIMEMEFSDFDAFYLYNPFEENLETRLRIDDTVELNSRLYEDYAEFVARQLAQAPIGTRLATYSGSCEEVPLGYECIQTSMDESLKLWEKMRQYPIRSSARTSTLGNHD